MSNFNRLQGERVFCHQCSHEWNRGQGGLLCPNCDSEFAEVIEAPPPRSRPEARQPPRSHNHPLYDHNPWPEADVPDPEEDDISEYTWNEQGANGTFSFSTTIRHGNGRQGRNVDDPNMRDLVHNFEGLLTQLAGLQNIYHDPHQPPAGFGPFPMLGPFGQPGRAPNSFAPDQDDILRPHGREGVHDPAFLRTQEMLTMMFSALNGPPRAGGQGRGPNQQLELPPFFANLLGPMNGRAGDAVFTNEAFDQVITQLMDQNNGSTAPPPASADAIAALPRKKVTADLMTDGKVECSICMEDLEVGMEITVLPCDHLFHPDCIKPWLLTHDTCPHCRKPITDHTAQPASPTSRRQRTSTSRRPSSVASPRAPRPGDGSAQNPYTLPDSPSGVRERRQQYFSNRNTQEGEDLGRSYSRRSGSSQSASRPRGGGSGNQDSPPGGAMGWMSRHNPFGS